MKIQILVDNKKSWIIPYAIKLRDDLRAHGHICKYTNLHSEIEEGDMLCLLSCEKIFRDLELNKYNLVVHESDLPKGKGWSPLTWQILEGKNKIPITLFEANKKIDSGNIYKKEIIQFNGDELIEEIKHKQGIATQKLILDFIKNIKNIKGISQEGEESFYIKRVPKDSELDIDKSLKDQFNLLRVVDNERYPAFFIKDGQKYIIKIYKDN